MTFEKKDENLPKKDERLYRLTKKSKVKQCFKVNLNGKLVLQVYK